MTASAEEKNLTEKREKRARSIAAMGLVNREGDRFSVSTPSLRGRQTSYEVWRDDEGVIRCNCLEYEEAAVGDSKFRCEHILAVKYALVAKNTEPATKQPESFQTGNGEKTQGSAQQDKIATEPLNGSGAEKTDVRKNIETNGAISLPETDLSENGEQRSDEVGEKISVPGLTEMKKSSEPHQLANTKGVTQMKQQNVKSNNLEAVESAPANNVLDFTSTLRELRQNVDPNLVKQREGWRDRNGNVQMVDYVEWHTVADILDETAPNWTHSIRDIQQIGDIITVTVAINIDGITREGIGTGLAHSEMGIKKAEHDALKRAAVKFGIARELYKKESDTIEREGAVPFESEGTNDFPQNPIARSLSDLVTAKQLGMIRAISREIGIDADEECVSVMNCRTDELSKRAASSLIQHLQDMQKQNPAEVQPPLRRAS
ncbi:MAG: Rad52/Rad22 family DNA repair protein [Pyrinomonadaceae bacterium]